MNRFNRTWDTIVSSLAIVAVVLTVPATYAVVNVHARPATITVALELPKLKGVVTVYDVINPSNDPLPPLENSEDYFEANIKPYATIPNAHYNTREFTAEEHACLAHNIYFEARNESLKGMVAVALVTLERVEDPRYPDNVCDVVYENKQFSWYWDGLSDRPKNKRKFHEIALIADAILDPDTAIYDFTYGSTHYHADYVHPYWEKDMIYKAKIGAHLFYREPLTITASL